MRRDTTALIVIIMALGLVFWGVHQWTDRTRAAGTDLLFCMDSSVTGSFSIEMKGADDGSADFVARLDRRRESGHLTAPQYLAFLRGFVQAGGQGLSWLAELPAPEAAASLPPEPSAVLGTPVDPPVAAPYVRATVSSCQAERAMPRPYDQRRVLRPVPATSSTPLNPTSVEFGPANYWYDVSNQNRAEHAHFVLHPFDSSGRRLLAYLQGTIVFTTWQHLGSLPADLLRIEQ